MLEQERFEMPKRKERHRPPPKWATQLYRLLAAGRYAAEWLPELLRLYNSILDEKGPDEARKWLLKELKLSVRFSIALRLAAIVHLIYRLWRTYNKVSGD